MNTTTLHELIERLHDFPLGSVLKSVILTHRSDHGFDLVSPTTMGELIGEFKNAPDIHVNGFLIIFTDQDGYANSLQFGKSVPVLENLIQHKEEEYNNILLSQALNESGSGSNKHSFSFQIS